MIVDSMSKTEVMRSIRTAFDAYCYPAFKANLKRYKDIGLKQIGHSIKKTFHYLTPKDLEFETQLTITTTGYQVQFYSTFHWRNRTCYAVLTDNNSVDVFQSHALDRYNERLLHATGYENKRVFESITRKMDNCFSIILPSPTHPLSQYLVIGGALFLGDYDPDLTDRFFWHNTCISPKEMGCSQSVIVQLLNKLATGMNRLGFNPLLPKSPEEDILLTRGLPDRNPHLENELTELLKNELLLLSLVDVDEFKLPDSLIIDSHLDIEHIKVLLSHYDVDPSYHLRSNRQMIDQIVSEIAYKGTC